MIAERGAFEAADELVDAAATAGGAERRNGIFDGNTGPARILGEGQILEIAADHACAVAPGRWRLAGAELIHGDGDRRVHSGPKRNAEPALAVDTASVIDDRAI